MNVGFTVYKYDDYCLTSNSINKTIVLLKILIIKCCIIHLYITRKISIKIIVVHHTNYELLANRNLCFIIS